MKGERCAIEVGDDCERIRYVKKFGVKLGFLPPLAGMVGTTVDVGTTEAALETVEETSRVAMIVGAVEVPVTEPTGVTDDVACPQASSFFFPGRAGAATEEATKAESARPLRRTRNEGIAEICLWVYGLFGYVSQEENQRREWKCEIGGCCGCKLSVKRGSFEVDEF